MCHAVIASVIWCLQLVTEEKSELSEELRWRGKRGFTRHTMSFQLSVVQVCMGATSLHRRMPKSMQHCIHGNMFVGVWTCTSTSPCHAQQLQECSGCSGSHPSLSFLSSCCTCTHILAIPRGARISLLQYGGCAKIHLSVILYRVGIAN